MKTIEKKSHRVVVGLSGGIDSAVSAFLLKKAGYDVICVYLVNWDSLTNNELIIKNAKQSCNSRSNYLIAQKVSKFLKLKFYKYNFEKEYWNLVFLPFIKSIKKGYTPNPDIFCNEIIKFKVAKNILLKKFNAQFFATGHYGKIINNHLFIPKDSFKDQTYFLSRNSINDFKKTIFPLSNLLKSEVYKIAKENNFPNINEKESMGICFIGKRNFSSFLKNYLPIKKGNFIDFNTKKILGKHDGYYYYTIDQRKGLRISSDEPYFVYYKDKQKNIVYLIKGKNNKLRKTTSATLMNIKFIDKKNSKLLLNNSFQARFRHGQNLINVSFKKHGNYYKVIYPEGLIGITPGQICAFYRKNECFGSGIIYKTFH